MFRELLFVHIVAVCMWLGGQLFMLAVVVPAFRSKDRAERGEIIRRVGQQFLVVSGPVLVVILVTGAMMASDNGMFTANTPAFQWKMVSVAVVLISTVVHVIAARLGKIRLSRIATSLTGIATLLAVWFAVHL